MKKLVIMTAAIFATVNIFAQGTVNFSSIGGGGITNSLTQARVVLGSAFQVQLYYAPSNSPAIPQDSSLMPLAGVANIGPIAGIFSGGTRTAPVSPPGTLAWFQVRAWETAFGASYEEAAAHAAVGGRTALLGKSNIVIVNTSDPTITPQEAPASLVAAGLLGFNVSAVPEPSVIGLGLLGAGALLMLRRRK
jgi:MYXO-CTERM domain-containing protein